MKKTWIIIVGILLIVIAILGFALYGKSTNKSSSNGATSNIFNPTSSLNLSGKGLSRVDTNIFKNTSIQVLDLSNNNLTGALPSEIGKLKGLKILNASNNQLTGIPAEIGQLSKLESIDFSNNNIDSMPNEIANLKNSLKVLNLSNNKYQPDYQAKIRAWLPSTKISF